MLIVIILCAQIEMRLALQFYIMKQKKFEENVTAILRAEGLLPLLCMSVVFLAGCNVFSARALTVPPVHADDKPVEAFLQYANENNLGLWGLLAVLLFLMWKITVSRDRTDPSQAATEKIGSIDKPQSILSRAWGWARRIRGL